MCGWLGWDWWRRQREWRGGASGVHEVKLGLYVQKFGPALLALFDGKLESGYVAPLGRSCGLLFSSARKM